MWILRVLFLLYRPLPPAQWKTLSQTGSASEKALIPTVFPFVALNNLRKVWAIVKSPATFAATR